MKVIMHNSVSLDGSLLEFAVDMAAHYRIARSFRAGIHLIGSNTALAGLKMFHKRLPPEQEKDLRRPKASAKLPLWVIPDSDGKLKGKLHVLRQSGFCRDVAILTTSATPKGYLRYLTERGYDWHYMGNGPIDYAHAFEVLAREYRARVVMSDSGPTLNDILLNAGLVDEISLLVHPHIVGAGRFALFAGVKNEIALKLAKSRTIAGKSWLLFRVASPRRGK
ncbi:MAG TPA: dihydrofolate reductase family protein [Candidatus Aminicenantes bacterium]|nr:dihydrofolate reductase family protein [Candidatus Aminicenantes bacterium]